LKGLVRLLDLIVQTIISKFQTSPTFLLYQKLHVFS